MKIHCENGMGLTPDNQQFPCYLDGKPFMGKGEFEGRIVWQWEDFREYGPEWTDCSESDYKAFENETIRLVKTRAILAITPPVEAKDHPSGLTEKERKTLNKRIAENTEVVRKRVGDKVFNKAKAAVEAQVNAMAHTLYVEPEPDDSVAMQADRFEIENSGRQILKFATEAHITDSEFPGYTIIVESGYTTLKETDEYAEIICKLLNDATRK